jgi:hypothetical protein
VLDVEHAHVVVLTRRLAPRAGHGSDILSAKNSVELVGERNDLILVAD